VDAEKRRSISSAAICSLWRAFVWCLGGWKLKREDIRVPVYLSDRTEQVTAEIQIRTIAMDFWASLEHDIRYKVDKTKLPEGINEEMLECAGKIAEIDRQMQEMYRRIKSAQGNMDC
jgi:putative GTP pyrophosphokinase